MRVYIGPTKKVDLAGNLEVFSGFRFQTRDYDGVTGRVSQGTPGNKVPDYYGTLLYLHP